MKTISVFVEGASDKSALTTLFKSLIEEKSGSMVFISFYELKGKKPLMNKLPGKAVNILRYNVDHQVVALPDLYPATYDCRTLEDLRRFFSHKFRTNASEKNIDDPESLENRFHVFCMKHNLEVLLLANPDYLKSYLDIRRTMITWKTPVEDQNLDHPPVRIVERIFHEAEKEYVKNTDAELILANQNYLELAELCPQCFKPFVEFLIKL